MLDRVLKSFSNKPQWDDSRVVVYDDESTFGDLKTVRITGLEIFAAGKWNGDTYSKADLQSMIDAFDKVGFEPVIKAGHVDGQEDESQARRVFGAPALGYIERLYLKGDKLIADLKDIPAKFGKLVKAGAYKRVSAEIYWHYRHEASGSTFPRVLKAVAFLGAEIPALTNLKAVEALFQRNETGVLVGYEGEQEFHVYDRDFFGGGSGMSMADYLMLYPRKEKAEVRYEETEGGEDGQPDPERCGMCKFYIFFPPACSLVEGRIEPMYVCKLFEPSEFAKSNAFEKKEGAQGKEKNTAEELEAANYAKMSVENRSGQFCVVTEDGGEVLGCKDTEEEANTLMASMRKGGKKKDDLFQSKQPTKDPGGIDMDPKELEQTMATREKELREQITQEFQAKLDDAAKIVTATKEQETKENEALRAEVRKLQAKNRTERINTWINEQKAQGRILPRDENKVLMLLEHLPDEGTEISYFSGEGDARKEEKASPHGLLKAYIEGMENGIFASFSKNDNEPSPRLPSDKTSKYADPGTEVDRRAKEYQAKNKDIEYGMAIRAVLGADPALASQYHRTTN